MLKITPKRLWHTFFIVVIVGVIILVVNSCLGVRVAGRCEKYIDDYTGYYLYKNEYKPLFSFNFGSAVDNGYKVWFLPGQKSRMLKKIKDDVHAELTDLVANNSDLLIRYEISDDFKRIELYYYKGAIAKGKKRFGGHEDEYDPIRIESKVELYHELIHGYVNTSFHSDIIHEIEVE